MDLHFWIFSHHFEIFCLLDFEKLIEDFKNKLAKAQSLKEALNWHNEVFGKKGKTTHVAISTGRFGILHSQGFVKKESLGFDDDNFNISKPRLIDRVIFL